MSDATPRRSTELWDSGLYCAESVLLAVAESQGIRSEWIPRVASGFCSGVARTGGMCGAVSGAIMALGLVAGRSQPQESVERVYALTRRLMAQFEQQFGALSCRQLTGCDLDTAQGQQAFAENEVAQRCRRYVEGAARLAVQLIG
jgi:C_GCAxxG_C_C family probable redox protein